MRLLLDSHTLIWSLWRPSVLSTTARRTIESSDNERLVSVVSLWELEIKAAAGKLTMPDDLTVAFKDVEASLLPIEPRHLRQLHKLPFHHRDPFDRLLIAQAVAEDLTIVTRDREFHAYGVPLLIA